MGLIAPLAHNGRPPLEEVFVTATSNPKLLIVYLGALVAIGPMSIDMYLPSLPAISQDLATTPDRTHLTVSAFLLGFCLGMFVYGPLSDQVGRRPLILTGLFIYGLASAACVLVDDIHALIAIRFVQALGGGAAAVLGRTVVRDLFPVSEAARVLSLMQVVTMLAPLVAPIAGGYVADWLGWRAIFAVLACFGVVSLALVYTRLPESLAADARTQSGLRSALRGYGSVISNGRSRALLLGGAAAFAGMFVYLTASPFVYIDHFGVRAEHYGYLFGLNIVAIVAVSLLNAKLVRRFPVRSVLLAGAVVVGLAGAALAYVTVQNVGGLVAIVVLLIFYIGVTGSIGANCIGLLMAAHPSNAGAATAAFGVAQFGLGAIASACVGFIDGPPSLGILIGLCGLVSVVSIAIAWRVGPVPEGGVTVTSR